MKVQQYFAIGIVKPGKAFVARVRIKATDKEWRKAIFGMGGTKKRIAGARGFTIDGQPIAVIGELPDEVADGTTAWLLRTDKGVYGFLGPCAVYNDAGFGPATLGITVDRLRECVEFDVPPERMQEALRSTIQARTEKETLQ